ncbi:hypothetical protein B6319_004282 [Salmonella enterica subsp. enterica serovar Saintpaul]|nr:hypothetical protein [Salmonella enterica subsp. enterica serovar Saintpaul]
MSILTSNAPFTRISIIRPGSLFCITTSLIVKITSANHPVIHTPPAATSWASCLFAVSFWYIMYP